VTVGVLLEYQRHKEYTFNLTKQDAMPGTSGSCWQVAAGLHAALFTLLRDCLDQRVYFPEDLRNTSFEELAERNLPTQRLLIDQDR
jgi:hypothetical protein